MAEKDAGSWSVDEALCTRGVATMLNSDGVGLEGVEEAGVAEILAGGAELAPLTSATLASSGMYASQTCENDVPIGSDDADLLLLPKH